MKKISILLLSSAMLLTACGNTTPTPPPSLNTPNSTTTPTSPTSGISSTAMPIATLPTGNCLQGAWSIDRTGLTTYVRNVMSLDMNPSVREGSINITFNGNNFIQEIPRMIVTNEVSDMTMEMTMSGIIRGPFVETAPGSLTFQSDGTGNTKLENITINGQPFTDAPVDMGDLFIDQNTITNYQCSGNTLNLIFPVEGTRTATMTLTRR